MNSLFGRVAMDPYANEIQFYSKVDTVTISIDSNHLIDCILVGILTPAAIVLVGIMWVLFILTIRDKGPFFYAGVRLGKNKEPFTIYKIRSLKPNAESTIGTSIFAGGNNMELWYGNFIRKSRIDELPQLWNVLCGTMTFVGPRPERPNVYAHSLCRIPGYDQRFSVLPGLTGYSQFLTPHNTSKRIRTLLDNLFTRKSVGNATRTLFILQTLTRCAYVAFREMGIMIVQRIRLVTCGTVANRRRSRRIPVNIPAEIRSLNAGPVSAHLVDISHETLRLRSDEHALHQDNSSCPTFLVLDVLIRRNGRIRHHRAKCEVFPMAERIFKSGKKDGLTERVYEWKATSDYNRYLIDKYALKASMA